MPQENNLENQLRRRPRKVFLAMYLIVFLLGAGIATAIFFSKKFDVFSLSSPKPAEKVEKLFVENFQPNRVVEETAKMSESADENWWVNSGGMMIVEGGLGKTVQGDLSPDSKWYARYKKSNPQDTDGGLHPQNIFRLVTRRQWKNLTQVAYFRINKINFSESENRNESNGILLFNRYQDGDNLYYTGLRVDGSAIIKKKYAGKYYTLSEKKYFPGEKYDREKNPNLLPLGEWIGLKSELRNTTDGNLEIRLYVDEGKTGEWKLAAAALDDGRKEFGKHIIDEEGHAGIRTDFMDVEFSDYKIFEAQ